MLKNGHLTLNFCVRSSPAGLWDLAHVKYYVWGSFTHAATNMGKPDEESIWKEQTILYWKAPKEETKKYSIFQKLTDTKKLEIKTFSTLNDEVIESRSSVI